MTKNISKDNIQRAEYILNHYGQSDVLALARALDRYDEEREKRFDGPSLSTYTTATEELPVGTSLSAERVSKLKFKSVSVPPTTSGKYACKCGVTQESFVAVYNASEKQWYIGRDMIAFGSRGAEVINDEWAVL